MRVLLIAVAASLLLAAPAAATPRWLAPIDLSADFVNVDPEGNVAVAPDGTAVIAWQQPMASGSNVLQAARRRPGEAFGPVKTLTPDTDNVDRPVVAIDDAGNATVAWTQETPALQPRIRAARLPAAGSDFEPIQTVSDPAMRAGAPAIGVGPNGLGVVLFDQGPLPGDAVHAAVRAAAGGGFAPEAAISGTFDFIGDKHVAINAAGDAIALFTGNFGATGVVQSNERVPGGSFALTGTPRSASGPGITAFDGAIVLDPTGRATALWTNSVATVTEVFYADRPPGGDWSPGVRASELPGASEEAVAPSADVAADGTVIASWSVGTSSGGHIVEGAVRTAGGAFGDYRKLSAPGMDIFGTSVDVNSRGDAVLAWSGGSQEAIYSVRRPAHGAFGGLETAVRKEDFPGQNLEFFAPDVALDDEANATAVWTRDDVATNAFRLQAAGFDAAPPTLAAVAVPAAGTASSGVGMAAAATDRWSPVSLSWAFGDGTSAAGGAVTHAFGKAGAFTVTVTATDAVGNATAASRPILVAAGRKRRIVTSVSTRWGTRGRFVFLLQMKVKRPPKGTVAELRCSGKRCPFKHKRAKKIRKSALDVHKALGKKTRFRAGQTLELRITKNGYVGKVVRYKLRKGKIPSGRQLCLPPGAKKARKRC